jgi:hypothetical protein
MKIISNDKLIKRYGTLGKYLNIAALIVLFGGMALTYFRADLFYVSLIALFAGFILSQVSVFFINRWGRVPRPDQQITSSLKGLTNDYTLYHYNTPISHLLVGPSGVWAILPYYQRGRITYENNKWKQKGGGIGLAYLKIFAQEGIGRPDLDAMSDVEKITSFLSKELATDVPQVSAAIVFTDKRADVQADGAPIPTLTADKLKDFIRRQAKENPYPIDLLSKIKGVLPQEEKISRKLD